MRRGRLALLLLAAAAAAAPLVPGGAWGLATTANEPEIEIEDFAFRPARKVVRPRALVRWKNSDRAPHNATALRTAGGRPVFRTRTGGKGARSLARAPARRGSYAYICSVHPRMRGTLVVR